MNYQWYPGHMTKARRAMQEDIRLIDLVIELVDARIPFSSRNPDIDALARGKARILLLNKADLADEELCRRWEQYFKEQGLYTALVNSARAASLKQIQPLIDRACAEKTERDRRRGIVSRPVRAMVCGIPNVGKSTFINSFAGKAAAKTGNKPGVTRGRQWIRLNKRVELLDTPGILWPRFDDQSTGEKLAMTGAIRDEILDGTDLAGKLILLLEELYPEAVAARYELFGVPEKEPGAAGADREGGAAEGPDHGRDALLTDDGRDVHAFSVLKKIAVSRRCLKGDGEPDTDRAAALLIDDFRKGKLGKITLEKPGAAM